MRCSLSVYLHSTGRLVSLEIINLTGREGIVFSSPRGDCGVLQH